MNEAYFYALFSLFHHDLSGHDESLVFDTGDLRVKSQKPEQYSIGELADVIFKQVTDNISDKKDSEISLTLTGGMDSRVILACLLKAGIKPNCLTYGNPGAKDIFFAKKLAKEFGIGFHNAVTNKPTVQWYYKWVEETIKRDNGNSHLHRAHRTAAIAEHMEKYSPKILFTGHMGGEGIRGLSYNSYFASQFFEIVNEGLGKPIDTAKKVLDSYFLKAENFDFEDLMHRVAKLPWMGLNKDINKLYFLYDLVGKIHHAQDIRLYESYGLKVVPVYLQDEYLKELFNSPYHFMAKKKGLMGRLRNPYVHCKLIQLLYPKLLDYPLSNGYKPREYLRGLWSYISMKLYRNYKDKNKYLPSFSYGQWYLDFVKEYMPDINSEIWAIYDRNKYISALENNQPRKDEGYWHKFSNPIFFDLREKLKKKENI